MKTGSYNFFLVTLWYNVLFLILFSSTTFAIYKELTASDFSVLFPFTHLLRDQELARFYKSRKFCPLWFTGGKLNLAGRNAVNALKKSRQEGLKVEGYFYFIDKISALERSFSSLQSIMEADILLTEAVVKYIKELNGETLRPLNSKANDEDKYSKNFYAVLRVGMEEDPSGNWIKSLTIEHPAYQELKNLLIHYYKIDINGGWPSFILPKDLTLKVGSIHLCVEVLKKILTIQGDLSIFTKDFLFDEEVLKSIKLFQRRHGLNEDGVVGLETATALNISVKDKIKQILISMEQWRKLPKIPEDRYVLINIPSYYLRALKKGEKALEMRVIVGHPSRFTPCLERKIDFIRLNPTWHVPYIMAAQDKLPILKVNPSYFKKNGYRIYDMYHREINPYDINWKKITPSSFNYRLVQAPNPRNALGKIFFHLTEPSLGICLHDTPDKALFNRPKRALSSGCIRLSAPLSLAYFALGDKQEYTENIIIEIIKRNETKDLILKNPLKVYIVYYTVWVDKHGKAHFAEDVYRKALSS